MADRTTSKKTQETREFGSKDGKGTAVKDWVDVESDDASFTKSNLTGVDPNIDPKKPIVWEQCLA